MWAMLWKPCAMRCDVAAGDRLFSLKTTYDERFARFSPGLLLEMAGVAHFHESSAEWLYSATNDANSPAFALYPDRQVLVDPVVILGAFTHHVVEKLAVPALRRLRRVTESRPRENPST